MRRAATCQTASGIAISAAPTWTSIELKGPHHRTRPVECPRPAAIETMTNTPKAIEAQRPGRGRPRPRRAIIDFHGSRTRMATPLVAWTISEMRAGLVPKANASQPVRNARASSASSAALVCAPSRVGT